MFGEILDGARKRDANKPERRHKRQAHFTVHPPTRDLSDEAISELGKRMHANPKAIVTNIEMHAYLQERNRLKDVAIARYGCCGDGPDEHGYCFGYGICPRYEENRRFVEFTNNFLKWIDEISEQTSLAAVAVRLSDSSSFNSEVSNV